MLGQQYERSDGYGTLSGGHSGGDHGRGGGHGDTDGGAEEAGPARTYLWLFGAVVLCQIPNFLLQLRSGDLVEDGLLTWNALSPACGVLFGVVFVCMLVRLRRQKREEQEDAEA